jgi:hypothetical protein
MIWFHTASKSIGEGFAIVNIRIESGKPVKMKARTFDCHGSRSPYQGALGVCAPITALLGDKNAELPMKRSDSGKISAILRRP